MSISSITKAVSSMQKPTHMYDALGGRKTRAGVLKAVVAARFENASQTFGKLCSKLVPFCHIFPSTEVQIRQLEDILARFSTWGHETGAEDQTLDYKLRNSSGLHETVVEALESLQAALDEGMQLVEEQQQQFQDWMGQLSDDTSPIEPLENTPHNDRDELVERILSLVESIDMDVDNLIMLGPSLDRPYPQNIDTYSSSLSNTSDISDSMDVERARLEFPAASSILQNRLGHANWKRRIAQLAIHEQTRKDGKIRLPNQQKPDRKTARQEVAQDAFNFQKPTLRWELTPPKQKPMFLPLLSATASSAETSDTASLFDTDMHKLTRTESVTTMATMASASKKTKPLDAQTLQLEPKESLFPKPPLQLTKIPTGKAVPFTCNFCGYDLEAGSKIRTEEDWNQHVLQDLEPYLCTFDKCFSGQETYARRDEWYRHELESHRIDRSWACPACGDDFSTKAEATEHLVHAHCGDFQDEKEIAMMKAMLQQTLSRRSLGVQVCPLCGEKLAARACKEHIARHLECFALLAMIDEAGSEQDDSDEIFSQSDDDAMSERGRKEMVLNTFVKEQFNLNVERGRQAETELVDLSDAESDSEARQMLMDKMFHGVRSGSTLSGERLPLLRTWSFPRNADFLGRDRELVGLYKVLSEPGRVCVVSGEGGMGKTALAAEYTWRYAQHYHYVFWVQAETPVGSSETFCQIAQQLRLDPEGADQDTRVRLGREFLEQTERRWLLVLDNVDRWADIDAYTPAKTAATQGSVLITTRHEGLTAPSRPVNYFRTVLGELGADEGRRLLVHGLPDELRPREQSPRDPEFRVAGEIAALAGLPLLIVYISGYIRKSGCTLSEFWAYWNEWRTNARLPGEDGRESVLYVALRDLSPDELQLLKVMAFLDSDGIQQELLEWADPSPGPAYLKKSRLRLIITKLKGQSIVTEKKQGDREIYSVHRLLQARLLREMNTRQAERDEIFGIAFRLIRSRLPRPSPDTPEPAKWRAFRDYLPHVLSLQRAYADPLSIVTIRPFRGLAELFKDGGVLLWQRYVHGDARKLLRSAERILDQLGGDGDDPELEELRAEINITLNLLLQYFGISFRKEIRTRSAAILAYYERRVARRMAVSGDAAPTADEAVVLRNARADYANTLLQFHDFAQAEPIYEGCLAASDGEGGGESFATAKLLHHLAFCRMYRRRFSEAVQLADRAARIVARVSEAAMALRYRFDLACIMLQAGDRAGALALHQSILKARLGFQGRASYFTLQSQYAVAVLYHYVGQLEEAEMLMKSALNKAAGRGGFNFWPDAAVARTKYHLSLVMRERGDDRLAETRRLANEAKDVLSRMLPYDPEPITGVREEDTLALFDHLQPVFGGRFTSTKLLPYVSAPWGK